jgi:hypothetical protein
MENVGPFLPFLFGYFWGYDQAISYYILWILVDFLWILENSCPYVYRKQAPVLASASN